ncbi:MAG: glycosyltransferase family 39 protein [Ignavibacteria bacterium]|nr:glycosyltransferase family 39 protein [Ignavibacteria bacterium]
MKEPYYMKNNRDIIIQKIYLLLQIPLRISPVVFLVIVCAMALIMRLGLVLFVGQIRSTAMYEPLLIAKNIAEGYGFSLHWQYESEILERQMVMKQTPAPPYGTTFIPPLVPYSYASVISIMGWNTNTLFFIMILQACLGGFLPIVVYYSTQHFFDEKSSRYAALLSLLYVPAAVTAITFSGSVFYSLFACAMIWALGNLFHTKRITAYVFFGVLSGLLALTRSEWYYIFFILVIVFSVYRKSLFDYEIPLRRLFVSLLCFFVVTGWWTLRNYEEFGRIIPVTGHPWREMWRGFNPYSTGSGTNAQGLSIREYRDEYTHIRKKLDSIPINVSFEEKADQIYKYEVLTFWQQYPMESVFLMIRKVAMLWTIDIYYDKSKSLLYIIPQLMVSVLIFMGFYIIRGENKIAVVLWSTLFICLSIVFSLTYVLPRYQSYIFPLFLPLAGKAMSMVMRKILHRKTVQIK